MEEEGLAKNPDLLIAQWKFQLESVPTYKNDNALKEKLMGIIKENKMSPYYEIVCKDLHWSLDANLLKEMKDAEENLGESEHREALLKKSEHLARIGDKDAAVEAVRMTNTKTVGLGNRMDLVFLNIRIGLFFMDHEIIK